MKEFFAKPKMKLFVGILVVAVIAAVVIFTGVGGGESMLGPNVP